MNNISIPDTMQALVLEGVRKFDIKNVPIPELEVDEVLCKVDTTYICGTDPHIIAGDFPGFWPKSFPFIPGHEWSGEVVKVGERSARLGWNIGDRVCAISHAGCGYCRNCLKGRYNLCLNYGDESTGHRQYGHYTQGAYAQYVRTSVKAIFKIPDDMELEVAACIDPLSIALNTVKRTRFNPGDDFLIMGTGPQGLMAVLCAKALGAGRIFIAGSGDRLKMAEEFGAIPINYRQEDTVEKIKEYTNGLGVPAITECAGTVKAIQQACMAAAKGGVISVIGIPHKDPVLPMKRMVLDEVEIVGVRANPNTAEEAISLVQQGRVDLEPLFTHRFRLVEFADALETYESRKDGAMKVAVKPN